MQLASGLADIDQEVWSPLLVQVQEIWDSQGLLQEKGII